MMAFAVRIEQVNKEEAVVKEVRTHYWQKKTIMH